MMQHCHQLCSLRIVLPHDDNSSVEIRTNKQQKLVLFDLYLFDSFPARVHRMEYDNEL